MGRDEVNGEQKTCTTPYVTHFDAGSTATSVRTGHANQARNLYVPSANGPRIVARLLRGAYPYVRSMEHALRSIPFPRITRSSRSPRRLYVARYQLDLSCSAAPPPSVGTTIARARARSCAVDVVWAPLLSSPLLLHPALCCAVGMPERQSGRAVDSSSCHRLSFPRIADCDQRLRRLSREGNIGAG